MLNFFKRKKPKTEQEIVIEWANILVEDSDNNGQLDKSSFDLGWHLSTLPQEEINRTNAQPSHIMKRKVLETLPTQEGASYDLEPAMKLLEHYQKSIESFLLKEEYITLKTFEKQWFLTSKGKLMKELGGHNEYKKYRKSEIELITNQGFINKLLITATFLSAIMPFVAAWIFTTKVYNTNVLPAPVYRPNVRIDSVWLRHVVDEELKKIQSNQTPTKPTSKQQTKSPTP